MRYLKLFEGFSEDFHNDLKSLDDKYISDRDLLLKSYKEKVDQFMFDLTDDYSDQKTYQNDHIMYSSAVGMFSPEIYYFLKCKWSDFENFLNILEEVEERLKSELELKLVLEAKIKGNFDNPSDYHTIGGGYYTTVSSIRYYYKSYYQSLRDEKLKEMNELYTHVEFKIEIKS